ncbi:MULTISPECIES: hypothetical protein [unclassified Leeuwenhoekiella]|uniref:hypothetical protein n=1 Tax=unclassified Leeuwenhoekiella TaxID=2615029 RepID=UPI000C643F8C|nr:MULTISPECIES: hypothetical protein [unclassified Leeuwenhoekiella]MAW97022.1 hypothetical protein [Leeuwenhoekiella sp.]MBA80697.1 hypothetical protein [Leeuwenhoekiella sp.]|tara:strand:+ start:33345 stop:34571 length:1227 start_codon:yes stop_codon:yes gene_type:complete
MKTTHTYRIGLALLILGLFWVARGTQSADQNQKQQALKLEIPGSQTVTPQGISVRISEYELPLKDSICLIASGTYGTTVLKPELTNDVPVFQIPPELTKHAGVISWQLQEGSRTIQQGRFDLQADTTQLGELENYLGPRSIVASERDYTMLVSLPTDYLDNLLPNGTPLFIKHQFRDAITTTPATIDKGFAWKNISAPLQTGRITTASVLGNSASRELVADVYPDLAENFNLSIDHLHPYADGNALLTFKTDQIRDGHGNVITDGTLVYFYMKDDRGYRWKTAAPSLNGFAFAPVLHPEFPTTWTVEAVVKGIARSGSAQVSFKPATNELPFSLKDRSIQVGPITSYLGQLIPDGVRVEIQIGNTTQILKTKDGRASFDLNPEKFAAGEYRVIVKALGLTTQKTIVLQ